MYIYPETYIDICTHITTPSPIFLQLPFSRVGSLVESNYTPRPTPAYPGPATPAVAKRRKPSWRVAATNGLMNLMEAPPSTTPSVSPLGAFKGTHLEETQRRHEKKTRRMKSESSKTNISEKRREPPTKNSQCRFIF